MKNPYLNKDGWYWYDETYDMYGPYKTEEEAKNDLDRYIKEMLQERGV